MKVKLKSKCKHIQVLQLGVGQVPRSSLIKMTHRAEVQLPSGDVGYKESKLALPPSLTVLAGQTVEVDEAALRAPDIQNALNAKPARLVKLS